MAAPDLQTPKAEHSLTPGTIIDIGGSRQRDYLISTTHSQMLHPPAGRRRHFPEAFAYDATGSSLWRKISRLPGYYQTRDEISLLQRFAGEIASHVAPGSIVIDFGCGELRKVRPLLEVLEGQGKRVAYYALDLDGAALAAELEALPLAAWKSVHCLGLWGTFDDGFAWIRALPTAIRRTTPLFLLSLGSGWQCNDHFELAVEYLRLWVDEMAYHDRMLVTLDATADRQKIWGSYHDPEGLFESFVRNALTNSNQVLGCEWYRVEDWELRGELVETPAVGKAPAAIMHRFVARAVRTVVCKELKIEFREGDELDCYEAFKYGPAVVKAEFECAGVELLDTCTGEGTSIYQYLIRRVGM